MDEAMFASVMASTGRLALARSVQPAGREWGLGRPTFAELPRCDSCARVVDWACLLCSLPHQSLCLRRIGECNLSLMVHNYEQVSSKSYNRSISHEIDLAYTYLRIPGAKPFKGLLKGHLKASQMPFKRHLKAL